MPPTRFSGLVTRTRATALLAVLALAVAAGCSDDDGARPAASVDGVEISSQEVVDELEAIRANEDYLAQVETQVTVLGEEDGTFDTNFVAQLLGIRIQFAMVEAEIEARGVEITEACTDAATEAMTQQAGGEAVFEAFDAEYRDYLVGRFARLVALESDLAGYPCVIEEDEALLEQYFEEHAEEFESDLCFTPIQVSTTEAAQEIVALLDAGADFDAIAAERSELPAESQCAPVGTIGAAVPELAELAPGERTIPVALQGVFFVFRLDEVREPTFENQRENVVGLIGQEIDAAFQEWFTARLEAAEVTVDPRYGTWDPTGARIDRPTE